MRKKKNFLKNCAAVLLAGIIGLGASGYLPSSTPKLATEMTVSAATDYTFCFPVNNGMKIAYYQQYDPDYLGHTGVDIHSSGDDTIYAAYSGVVQQTNNSCPHVNSGFAGCAHTNSYGNSVYIKGDNGLYFIYGHLKQNTILVKAGDRVTAGQPIATMGSSGASTGKHLHFEVRTNLSVSTSRINANPVGKYSGVVTYVNGPYGKSTDPYTPYDAVSNGNYYFKNVSTGTYLTVDGAKAANGQNMSVAAKKDTNAFKFGVSGSASTSYAFTTLLDTGYVVNPYSDTPGNGTNVTLYKKTGDDSQLFRFKKVSDNTYIIHNVYDYNQVLGVNGTNVQLQTHTGKDTQKWVLESVDSVTVTFNRNLNSSDTKSVKETFTAGVSNQKFGYKTDGTGRYNTMNDADVGFGEWTNSGYKMLGWSTDKNATTAQWKTYSSVIDSWIKSNAPSITLYAVWENIQPEWSVYEFKGSGTQEDPYQIGTAEELIEMQKAVNEQYYNPTYGHAYYIQTADIDLGGQEWMPIGVGHDGENADGDYNYKTRMFYGSYDGNGHYITNLKITNSFYRAGLFGYVREGAVSNLVVTGTINEPVADAKSGGIAGELQYGSTIQNCAFIGDVTSATAGGITGCVWNGGTISNCYHTGNLSGSTDAAGIVAQTWFDKNVYLKQTMIENCYHADGSISGGTLSGAIVANIKRTEADDCKVLLVNCFAPTTAAAGTNPDGVNTDTTLLKTNSEMRLIAEDLGGSFVYNENVNLNAGYPVFDWQVIPVKGDVNTDNVTNVLDVVLLQKWILAVPDTTLPDSNAADIDEDGIVDIFDLAILKRLLIGG